MSTNKNQLEQVFSDDTYQLTGVAVAKDGRVFTCYPLWPGPHKYDVVEILPDNKVKPYPDEQWNNWKEVTTERTNGFVCRQCMWMMRITCG
ncbi:hypothetical protein ACX0G7_12940 [Flavitalea antarctica]